MPSPFVRAPSGRAPFARASTGKRVLQAWSAAALTLAALATSLSAQCEVAWLPDPTPGDTQYGVSVALDGDVALIGNGSDPFGFTGCQLFERQADGWTAAPHGLWPDDLTTTFGKSVAIDGDTAVVAAQDLDEASLNALVYERVGGAWVKTGELGIASSSYILGSGLWVSLDGDRVLLANAFDVRADLFERAGGSWLHGQTLQAAPGDPPAVGFGFSSSLHGGRAVVGGAVMLPGPVYPGCAWVFEDQGGGFVPTALLLPEGGEGSDQAGTVVAQDGDVIALGAPLHDLGFPGANVGTVFVFELVAGEWTQTAALVPPAPQFGDVFGSALALSGDTLLVGAPWRDGPATDGGAVFVYHRSPAGWTLVATVVPDAPVEGARFGQAIAIDGDTVLIGAPGSDPVSPRAYLVRGVPGLAAWMPLGGGVTGTLGAPCSFGHGDPAAGGAARLTLTRALPDVPAFVVAGLSRLNLPFKGGLLVPAPDLVLPLPTDAAGEANVEWTWPTGVPPGAELWLQHWQPDAGAVAGYAAADGLAVVVPSR